jgi:hypothetical protein
MAYHMLHRRQPYQDLGSNYSDEQEREAISHDRRSAPSNTLAFR